jgi:hypothetical protein
MSADTETRGFGVPSQSRARRQFPSHPLFLRLAEIIPVAQTSLILEAVLKCGSGRADNL